MLQTVDAYRKPARFKEFLLACSCDFHGRPGYAQKPYPQSERLDTALNAANRVNAGEIAAALSKTELSSSELSMAINIKIREARIASIKAQLT